MLNDAITAALPQLRTEAEAMMVDHCTIKRQTGTTISDVPPFDEVPTYEPVWSGKCRVQTQARVVGDAAAGEHTFTVEQLILQLPIDGTDVVREDDVATIDESPNDPAQVGRVLIVRGGTRGKTHATKRSLACEEVSS